MWVDQFSLSVMCTPRNLKLTTLSTTVPSMWIGVCSLCCFLKAIISTFVLRLLSWYHSARTLTSLLAVSSLLVIRPTTVVSSANLMIELEVCMATQSRVNRLYRRGLRTHPCVAPVLRISGVEMLFPTLATWGRPVKVQNPVAEGCVETQDLELNDEFGG